MQVVSFSKMGIVKSKLHTTKLLLAYLEQDTLKKGDNVKEFVKLGIRILYFGQISD